MIAINELKGIIASRGYSQRKVAQCLNINEKTFYSKMSKGVFDSDEIEEMIKLLEIKDPMQIFFTNLGARYAPNGDMQHQ